MKLNDNKKNFFHSFIYFTQLKNILQILQILTDKYIY